MEKNFLPISIDISNAKILIVGGGKDAYKKLKILQRFDAQVTILANDICGEIKKSGALCIRKSYERNDLNGYLMVYSCSNDDCLDRQIVTDARDSGILVNIHDRPELCQFVSPAIYKHGHITVAVGSNGEDVHASIRIRDIVEQFLEKAYFKNK